VLIGTHYNKWVKTSYDGKDILGGGQSGGQVDEIGDRVLTI
jgi:hypothetical protein